MQVTVGEPAPEFTLEDQHGQPWSLANQRGRPVVLYFYPKDDTPGCTSQACDVRDHWAGFTEAGAAVAGISPDDVASHGRFAAKHELPHTLLADPEREVIETYGAWGEKIRSGKASMGVIRSSVVIDADGHVAAVFDQIEPAEQSAKALEAVRALA
ncbi:MAG: peroxiredoxin [Egibacteraceae bacterium]